MSADGNSKVDESQHIALIMPPHEPEAPGLLKNQSTGNPDLEKKKPAALRNDLRNIRTQYDQSTNVPIIFVVMVGLASGIHCVFVIIPLVVILVGISSLIKIYELSADYKGMFVVTALPYIVEIVVLVFNGLILWFVLESFSKNAVTDRPAVTVA